MELVRHSFTTTNHYHANGMFESGPNTFENNETCQIKCSTSYLSLLDIQLLRDIKSPVTLCVYDVIHEAANDSCSVVVEPLKPDSTNLKRPTTLSDVLLSGEIGEIFDTRSSDQKYVFSLKFKQFIREWIEVIVSTRKKYTSLICCDSPNNIVVNQLGNWKLCILDNKASDGILRERIFDSVHNTITKVVDMARTRLEANAFAFAEEINHLLKPISANIHIGRHPSLLPPGGKQSLLFSVCDAIDHGKISFLSFKPSQTFGPSQSTRTRWFDITDPFPLLRKATRYDVRNPSIELKDYQMQTSTKGFLKAMKNVFKHINDYTTDSEARIDYPTPLGRFHTNYYETSHIENIVDILFPVLASLLHEDANYSNSDMCDFFWQNIKLEPEP